MAIAHENTDVELKYVGAASGSTTKSVTAGNKLIAICNHYTANGATTMSDTENTWTTDRSIAGSFAGQAGVYSAQVTNTNASLPITATTGGTQSVTVLLLEFSGVKVSSPVETSDQDDDTDTNAPRGGTTGVTTTDNDLLVMALTADRDLNSRGYTGPSGWTYSSISTDSGRTGYYAYKICTSTVTAEKGILSQTGGGAHYAGVIVAYLPAAAPPPGGDGTPIWLRKGVNTMLVGGLQ